MKKNFSAIIVDDERLARKELMSMLKEFENIKIIGEAEGVKSAKVLSDKLNPDLIFLDIQMPGESGFALAEQVNPKTKIIFVTAYDEFAVRAFEVNALDYLMKPVNPDRLKKAIEKLSNETKKTELITKSLSYDDTLFILLNSQMKFVKISDILFIESSGDYSELNFANNTKGLTSKPMNEWEERLPENHFIRIHRTSIINLNYVQKVEEWFNNSFRVYLNGKTEPLLISRRYASKLKEKMG
jgi:two-component system, LytTR family, response regulator